MSDTSKSQNFLHGTILLTLSAAIVKVIGALYKIPLNAIIGPEGFSYFNTAYEIYTVLLMVSTAGLPVAMSRMIAQSGARGHYRQVRKIYTTCRAIFLGLGLAGGLLMTVFCRQLAAFQEQPDAWAAIGALGPCAFFICLISTYRGFFQGQSNMMPTSVSQVLEALCKLIVGMAAAVLVLRQTGSIPLAAAGAILGVTAGTALSSLYLKLTCRKSFQALPESHEEVSSGSKIAKQLLSVAVPITIGSAGLQLLTMLETKVYMSQLLNTLGYTQSQADTMKGIYNMTQTIFNMPCAFITPISVSIIPAITALLTRDEAAAVKATEESGIRITGLISLPCAVGLSLLAGPVTALLGGYSGQELALSTSLLSILGMCIVFNAIVLLTNAIMQAHGNVTLPVINMFIGGILKLVVIYILTGNPHIGIVGTPIGTLVCYITITVLNLICMKRVFRHPPAIFKCLWRPVLAAAIMGAAVYGTWWGLERVLGENMNRLIGCAVPVLVGVVVYGIAAIKLKAITREDCLLLPKGEKIAKLLHL